MEEITATKIKNNLGGVMAKAQSNYAATRSMVNWYLENNDWVKELNI